MCRLLGIAAPAPMTIVEAVGSTTLSEFQALARLHSDGWGLAWQGDSGPEVEMHAESGSDLAERVGGVTTEAAIVHLRWASVGDNLPENTHPFLDQGVAFAHNGTITPASLLDDLLSDAVRPGITDPGSIEFRHEETELAAAADPERHYVEVILPRKVALYVDYVRTRSLLGDLRIILHTFAAIAR